MPKNNFSQFTIITPSFNQADFISQTIDSVLSQKYSRLNYWVMDGKSSDDTLRILQSYVKEIHFVSKKDDGQTDALNKGIATAFSDSSKTGIFAYINSDDYYLPGAFEKVSAAFAAHPDKMWLVGDAKIIDGQNQEIQHGIRVYKKVWRSILSFFLLTILNPLPQPAVFIRAEAIDTIGVFNTSLHYVMDYEYWLRLYQHFGKPIILPDALATFRIHASSKGTTGYIKQFKDGYEIASKYTKNWLALLLHKLHNQVIFLIYRNIK